MKPEYNELIAEVKEIDPKAADYLLYEAPKLKSFDPYATIVTCFEWLETPQGDIYWNRIDGEVKERRSKR